MALHESRLLRPQSMPPLAFDPAADIVFDYGPPLPGHANGLVFAALDVHGNTVMTQTYYSIGGGFVITAAEREAPTAAASDLAQWPYPFDNAASMLAMSRETGLSVAAMKRENEIAVRPDPEVERGLAHIWLVMNASINRGMARDGELPGGLHARRRARRIHQQLLAERWANSSQPHAASDWLSVYAMAVNEENAAGGQVVTAPTNAAAGVVPAVLCYYLDHCPAPKPPRSPISCSLPRPSAG